MKKIEITILLTILTEAFFLLFFFKYSFLNIILGIIIGMILILITKNIPKNNITKILLITVSIILYLLSLYKIALFINNNILKNYSFIIITLSIIIVSFYIAKKKYHAFIKTCEILFYIIIILKVISLILTLPLFKLSYFKIDLDYSYHFIFIALFTLFLFKNIYYMNDYKINNKEILLSFTNPIFIKLITIITIGSTLSTIYQYPYVDYLKMIRYFDFIERMEGILSFEYLFCFIIMQSFFLLSIKKSQ